MRCAQFLNKTLHYHRICSRASDILRFSSHFIDGLLGTSSKHWIAQTKRHNMNVFSHSLLVMPYLSGKHRSLFIVLGANNINDYMKHGFTGTRPCILHIVPYGTSDRRQLHAYNGVSSRIRMWLNALWQNGQCNDEFRSMPFTHRSMPMTRPFGKVYFYPISTVHQQTNSCEMIFSPLSCKEYRCQSLSFKICTLVNNDKCRHFQ